MPDNPYAHAEDGWDFLAHTSAREYYARLGTRVNPRRATPFLGDYQLRSIFETVTTGEWL